MPLLRTLPRQLAFRPIGVYDDGFNVDALHLKRETVTKHKRVCKRDEDDGNLEEGELVCLTTDKVENIYIYTTTI